MKTPTREYSEMLYKLAAEIRNEEGCVTESADLVEEAAERMDLLTVTIRGLEIQRAELMNARASRQWPIMGYGRVAIGGGRQPNGSSALLYMDMGETRPINADATDLFPVGSIADQNKLMACIYFKDAAAIQQTIDVLREMQEEISIAKGGEK